MTDNRFSPAALGAAVRSARKTRGWTQDELGERSGLSRPTIARIERGEDISTATVSKVTKALGLNLRIEP